MRRLVGYGTGLAVVLGLGLPGSGHAGGGWTRKAGSGYAKIGLTTVNTRRYYTLSGAALTTARFRQQVVGLYGEYGLTSRLEAQLNFPLYRRAAFSTSTATQGIGDAQLGLRYGLLTGAWPLAVSVTAELPTGNPDARGRNKDNPQLGIALPTGDGELNVWTRAALSHSLNTVPAYATLEAGYNVRTKGFTDQYSVNAQLGYKVLDKAWLTATARTLANVRAPRPGRLASIGIGEGVAYSTAGLGVNYAVTKHLWATADWATGFGRLRNVYGGHQFTFGLAVEW